jgi:hypothetical protein
MSYKAARFLTLIVFGMLFEGVVFLVFHQHVPDVSWLLLVSLGLAASFGGRAVAYMTIFEWLRHPFTEVVTHSSGTGESVEAKGDDPVIGVIGSWMSCPLCAGTWVALGLFTIFTIVPTIGSAMIYILGAASFAALTTRFHEKVEWESRLAWENTGYMNRLNKAQEATKKLTKQARESQVVSTAEIWSTELAGNNTGGGQD